MKKIILIIFIVLAINSAHGKEYDFTSFGSPNAMAYCNITTNAD
jgi:hypothetical protein